MLFVGDDWAEDHHDVEVVDGAGNRLGKRRLPEGVAGVSQLHAMIADHLPDDAAPADVVVGIETDRGPWVQALLAAGYTVFAVNPLQAARYRERHGVSGAKSDPGDAHVLAELVRLDRAHHRPIAGDSDLAEHVKVLARTHQGLIWSRQRQVNTLRSILREFYPAALVAFDDLAGRDALAVLAAAPGPEQGRRLTRGAGGVVVAPRRSATQPPDHGGADRGGVAHRAAHRPTSGRRGLRGQHRGSGRRHHRAGRAGRLSWPSRWVSLLAGTRTLRSI